jgi:GNAT superfamily N-acetyltransferase
VQQQHFLRRQFRLYRLWVLEGFPPESGTASSSPVAPGIDLRFLNRHERRDWICQRTSDADWDQYRAAITNEHDLVIASREGRTLGWAWLGYDRVHLAPLEREILLPKRSAYLYDCWVRPEERGRGLGKALIAARQQHAQGRSLTKLLTHVEEGNHASRQALERNGFSVVGRTGFLRLPLVRLWTDQPFRGSR